MRAAHASEVDGRTVVVYGAITPVRAKSICHRVRQLIRANAWQPITLLVYGSHGIRRAVMIHDAITASGIRIERFALGTAGNAACLIITPR